MTKILELHDSVILKLEQIDGDKVCIHLNPAVVYPNSSALPKSLETDDLSEERQILITIESDQIPDNIPALPCGIWNGGVQAPQVKYDNVIPIPFECDAKQKLITLTLILMDDCPPITFVTSYLSIGLED
ncbi:hypothetical protein JNK13_09910 [bacterium]|nr:hypothetical protein [bacterium]